MIKIVLAESKENLDSCLEIRKKVFIEEKKVPETIEIDEEDVLCVTCNHFLVKYDGICAGTFRCKYINKDEIKVQRFCFLKEFRNKGIGKKALNYIENYYSKKGINTINLDSKFEVYKFYEKCGYEKISDVFEEANIPHVKMIKKL